MKLICAMCESRRVYVQASATGARRYGSSRGVAAHDLCHQCYRKMRNRVVAARLQRKPFWAIRSTLRIMEEQRTTMQTKDGRSLG